MFSFTEKPVPDHDRRGEPDPRVLQLWLDAAARPPAPPAETIADVRAGMGWPNLDLSHGVSTETLVLEGRHGAIPTRVYRPGPDPRGVIVFFHGGGFVGGSLKTVENPCKLLAERSGATVVSVDYRLAPEHPFPAPLEDSWDAVKALRAAAKKLGLTGPWATAGDSAGGNLALSCALLGVREGAPLDAVLTVYPVVDMRDEGHLPWSEDEYEVNARPELVWPSVRALKDGGRYFTNLYLAGGDASDPLVSPWLHPRPEEFPPTLVVTAEYDFLRVEGEAFARRLADAGVRARVVRYRGLDHAYFDKLGLFPQAADTVGDMAAFFRELTADPSGRLKAQLAFLLESDKLKLVVRRNELADASRRENTAEHSWHLVLFAMTLAEHAAPGIDTARAVRLVAVHDLVEIDAGDTFFWDAKGYEDKEERERAAAKRLFGLLPPDQAAEYEALWEEFEACETPESVFANAVDKLAPVLLNSHSGGRSWREHGITAAMVRDKMTVIAKASPRLGQALEELISRAEASGALEPAR